VHVSDWEVRLFSRLPRLKRLVLESTGIGDEAMMLIVGLKYSLEHLNIAGNLRVTDVSTACMVKLRMLNFVILKGTNISMEGLRRLAAAFRGGIKLVPPSACEDYLKRVPVETMANWRLDVGELTVVQLKYWLGVFAKHDASISLYGLKDVLQKQLEGALQRSREYFLVKKFLVVSC